VIQGAQNSE